MTNDMALRDRVSVRPIRNRLSRWVRRLSRRMELHTGRRAARHLMSLDDRLLADIGIDRSDVVAALGAPPDIDPTVVLAHRRRRRMAADRAGLSAKYAYR